MLSNRRGKLCSISANGHMLATRSMDQKDLFFGRSLPRQGAFKSCMAKIDVYRWESAVDVFFFNMTSTLVTVALAANFSVPGA